jgi:hypothetical protein
VAANRDSELQSATANGNTDRRSDDNGIWLFCGLCLGALIMLIGSSVVWLPAAPPPVCDAGCIARHDLLAQQSMASAAWTMLLVALMSLLVSVLAVYFVRATLAKTSAAVDAANRTADEAKRIGEAQVRPYVSLKHFRWTWHVSLSDGSIFYRIRPVWTNTGTTPTRSPKIFAQHVLSDRPLEDDFRFVVPTEVIYAPIALAKDDTVEGDEADVGGWQLLNVRNGSLRYYVWDVATYNDVFPDSPVHTTRFCYYIDPAGVTGDPTMAPDEATNVVRLHFKLHSRNNCSDEECDR